MGKVTQLKAVAIICLGMLITTFAWADGSRKFPSTGSGGVDAPNVTRPLNLPSPPRADNTVSSNTNQLTNPSSVDGGSVNAAQRGTRPGATATPPVNVRLNQTQINQTSQAISGGHALHKHVRNTDQRSLPYSEVGVTDQASFNRHVNNVLTNPTASKGLTPRQTGEGRQGFWHQPTGSVVIRDTGASDMGTSFRPANGVSYYNGLQ